MTMARSGASCAFAHGGCGLAAATPRSRAEHRSEKGAIHGAREHV
jgi:hypothetical protein